MPAATRIGLGIGPARGPGLGGGSAARPGSSLRFGRDDKRRKL